MPLPNGEKAAEEVKINSVLQGDKIWDNRHACICIEITSEQLLIVLQLCLVIWRVNQEAINYAIS